LLLRVCVSSNQFPRELLQTLAGKIFFLVDHIFSFAVITYKVMNDVVKRYKNDKKVISNSSKHAV